MDKFYFYSKSKNLPVGKGIHEEISDSYDDLNKINNWRRILSNFHESIFTYNGKKYKTIEHAFQAQKFPSDISVLFEVGNKIGDSDGNEARKNRKIKKLSKTELDIWNNKKDRIMYDISLQKYKSSDIAKNVLLNTKNAELWHIQPRQKPIRFHHLESIRKEL
tara:strand:- start:6793 stop:7281 length:489 start_codon:yes stop_codon:yes gene_type:complete